MSALPTAKYCACGWAKDQPLSAAAHVTSLLLRLATGAEFPGWPMLLAPLFRRADAKLYEAKQNGRNRVELVVQ